MADNVSTSAGTFAADDIGSVYFERVKIVLGADGVNDGDVHSSNPLPVSTLPLTATLSSADNTVLDNISTFTNSTNTLLVNLSSNTASTNALVSTGNLRLTDISTTTASSVSLLSSNLLRLNSISTFANSTNTILAGALASTGALWVQALPGSAQSTISATVAINTAIVDGSGTQITSFGGGTQYVQGNTTTLPTGTVMLWKSAVSTISPVTTSLGLPVNVVAGSLNANTEYVEGDTSTAPTGIVMLWKAGVSTLRAASTSDPFPVSTLPATVSLGSTDNTLLDNISTFTNSTNTLLINLSSNTASTNALVSTGNLRLTDISSNTASTNALLSSNKLRLENISTFTNSTNTLLIQVSSNTASSNALLSTISLRLAPAPTGPYVQPVPVSSNGLSVFRTLDADETEEEISATPCTVYGMWVTNTSTATAYVKLYNGTSSAIHTSSATALITIGIPGNASDDVSGVFNVGGMGITFSTACCIAAGTTAADTSTVPGESTVICNVFYKA